jgi:HJR/Mrr/RecB family endonuclease
MVRYNDHYALLRRIIICHACGKANRCYIDDPTLQIKCGQCLGSLDPSITSISDTFMAGLYFDQLGFPLPPRPLTKLRRVYAEVLHFLINGNPKDSQQRVQEAHRYEEALAAHKQLCEIWTKQLCERAHLKRREEQERIYQIEEEKRRQQEQALEIERRRIEAERRRREEFERSGRAELLRRLDAPQYLSDRDFEELLGQIFEAVGCKCEVTKRSGDQGVDVIACGQDKKRIAIQAKHWAGSVGNSAVQEVFSGMKYYKCDTARVVATSGVYTSSARELARVLDVSLWGIDELRQLLLEKGI